MGKVIKLKTGWKWESRIMVDGKRTNKSKSGFKTKKEAEIALQMYETDFIRGGMIEPSRMLYLDLISEWLETKSSHFNIQTSKVYKTNIKNRILPNLGRYRLNDLNKRIIQRFINELHKEGLSPGTIKKIYNNVRSSLNYALNMNYIPKELTNGITLPREQKKEMNVWSKSEILRFLDKNKNHPKFLVFQLAITTGLRRGEILGLRWQDIDFTDTKLFVKQTLSSDSKTILTGAKTNSSIRAITLIDQSLQLLKEQLLKRKEYCLANGIIFSKETLIFINENGNPYDTHNLRRTFISMIKKSNVPLIRFHDLRHTHATLLLQENTNVKVISERLGHKSIKITLDTYSHVTPHMQEEVTKKLNSFFG